MKITLEIPNGMKGCFLTGLVNTRNWPVNTRSGPMMICYPLDSDDLHDGAEIKLTREGEE